MFLWGAGFYVPLGCQFLCSSGVPVSMFLWGASCVSGVKSCKGKIPAPQLRKKYDSEMIPKPACLVAVPAGTGGLAGGSEK